jgi:peptidyl-dipeptidase Dcp
VLKQHARHWKTSEVISDALVTQLKAARKFGQGFGAVEYLSCALIDQKIHELTAKDLTNLDLDQFEKEQLQNLDMPQVRHPIYILLYT